MKEIFDTYITNCFGKYEQSLYKIKQFAFNYKKYFELKNKQIKILDIGIGRGEMLSCCKEWGYYNYKGIDISPDTINFCLSLGLNCQLIDNLVEWLTKHSEEFEIITMLDVLEHIKKDEIIPLLKTLKRSLTINGTLIIQTPNMQAPDAQLHRYNDITHEVGFSEHSLSQVLLAANFNNFHFYGFEESINNNIKHKLAKIIRIIFWKITRLYRRINVNLNPKILNSVFYAVVKNSYNDDQTDTQKIINNSNE